MTVRRAKASEMAAIQDMDAECFPEDHSPEFQSAWWWVAEDRGSLVGYAGAAFLTSGDGYLCRAGVLPEARGQGIQKGLIHARLKWYRRAGTERVVTYVSVENLPSLNNLYSCGLRAYDYNQGLLYMEICL